MTTDNPDGEAMGHVRTVAGVLDWFWNHHCSQAGSAQLSQPPFLSCDEAVGQRFLISTEPQALSESDVSGNSKSKD